MMGSKTQNRKTASESRLDIGWEHAMKVDNDPRKIQCIYCNAIMLANINRFKHHLACTKQDVKACSNVPSEVKEKMFRKLKKFSRRKIMNDEEEEMVERILHKRDKKVIKSFSSGAINITQSSPNQNVEKRLRDEASEQIAKLEKYKLDWKKTGCSVICDECTNMKGRFYCNFLVNCPRHTIFWKSIDTSDFLETTIEVFKVLDNIVEEVGEDNVVQVITNNTANYKAAAGMLIEKRKGIFWSPCVIRLLDEILENFEENLLYHHITIAKGKKIRAFVYSRPEIVSMLKKRTNGKNLIGLTLTPYATEYLNLLYIVDMKESLMTIFSSKFDLAETREGGEIQQILQDYKFWDGINVCLKSALPIIEILLKIDFNQKSTPGFIYEEMNSSKERLQSLNNAEEYETIWEIIKERSDPLLRPLYRASYYLRPQMCYGSRITRESILPLCFDLATIGKTFNNNSEVTAENMLQIEQQFANFEVSEGLFGSVGAETERDTQHQAEWWASYGNDCPELQRIAIRLLSLTCSFCGSAKIWNAYDKVDPETRSCLYQKKLHDLFLIIQKFQSKLPELELDNSLASLMKSSSYNGLITEKEVGEVSGAKKDMLIRGDADGDFSEGVFLPENYSGNEVDAYLYNPQPQSTAPGTFVLPDQCP